jgi:hypothetical protein
MDPRSSYFLNIIFIGNPNKAIKDWRCFCFDKVIDLDITNFKDFIEAIVDQYRSGYLEVPHIHSYDSVVNIGGQRLFKCSFPKLIPSNHLYLSQSGRVMILPHHLKVCLAQFHAAPDPKNQLNFNFFQPNMSSSSSSTADLLKNSGACLNSMDFVEYLKGCSTTLDLVELGEITHHYH